MASHKNSSHNYLQPNYHFKLYEVIREHGGWENVECFIIAAHQVDTRCNAMVQEQKYIVQHKANLNSMSATSYSLNTLFEMKDMTPTDTVENKLKRSRLTTQIWKKTTGKEKYNAWQAKYMRGRMAYNTQAKMLRYCLL
jgi:menaquinone-dependent protoporphyrinogen IX oxidase